MRKRLSAGSRQASPSQRVRPWKNVTAVTSVRVLGLSDGGAQEAEVKGKLHAGGGLNGPGPRTPPALLSRLAVATVSI